jgi:hypothetical protein
MSCVASSWRQKGIDSFHVAAFHRHFIACADHLEFFPEGFVDFFPHGSLPHSPIASERARTAVISGISCAGEVSARLFVFIFADGISG